MFGDEVAYANPIASFTPFHCPVIWAPTNLKTAIFAQEAMA
jgi:hypothetical protein